MIGGRHFCEDPRTAVCGAWLAANDFAEFYNNTTNCFADITCKGCRDWVRTYFAIGGFPEPPEWKARASA